MPVPRQHVTPPPTAAPLRPLAPRQRRLMGIAAVVAAAVFVGLGALAHSVGPAPFDASVQQFVQDQRSPLYERPIRMITHVGSGWVLLPVTGLACMLIGVRYRALAIAFALTAVGTFALGGIAKGLVGRPRPNVWGFGYPSGHVLGIVVFCGMLLYALWVLGAPRALRRAMAALSIVAILAIAVSRLYVNTHWLSDVIGGVAAGTTIALAIAMVMDRRLGGVALPAPRAEVNLARTVEVTPLETKPFDHVYMREIFPADYYAALLAALPATNRYRELRHREAIRPDGRSARRKFYLFPEHILLLPTEQRAFWLPLAQQLRSPELQDAFKHRFRGALERRFGKSIDSLSFYLVPMLLRDFGGYRIGIHGDSMSKAVTAQFYLPRDASQAHLGTLLHEGRHGDAATRVVALSFLPATGYAFPVMRHESWHSVAQTSQADGERNSLMLTYYIQDTAGDWLLERLKRIWLFVVYGLRR